MTSSAKQICAILAALLLAHVHAAEEVTLPRSVKVCKHDTPDYSSCLRLALQESWMTFVKGIPELGLPVLDPMVIDVMENEYEAGEVAGRFVLRDVHSYGLARTNFRAVRPYRDGNKMNFEIDVQIPKVFIEGNYKAEGAVGPYRIGGKGYFNVSMEGVTTTWGIEGHVENDRYIVEHFRMSPEVEKMHVYFSDMFNGNRDLNNVAMRFVNEYWPVLYKSMLPTVQEHWDVHLTDYVNRLVFSKISVSKYLP